MTVLNDADNLYLDTRQVSAVYVGDALVWGAPGFDPTGIAGLKVWLDASEVVEAPGAAAALANLAPGGATASTVGTPPPTVGTALQNGNKVVRFRANEGRLRMTGTGVKWAHTLVYVARLVGPTAGRVITAAYQPPNYVTGFWNALEDVAYSTTGTFFTPDVRKAWTTNWHLYGMDADASPEFGGTGYHPRLLSDGVVLSTGGQADGYCQMADAWYDTFNISGYSPTGTEETCDCEVAEVLLYDRKLADAERQQVEGYLRTKWGL